MRHVSTALRRFKPRRDTCRSPGVFPPRAPPYNLLSVLYGSGVGPETRPVGVVFTSAATRGVRDLILCAARDRCGDEFAILADALGRSLLGSYPWCRSFPTPAAAADIAAFVGWDDVPDIPDPRAPLAAWLLSDGVTEYMTAVLREYLRGQLSEAGGTHAWLRVLAPDLPGALATASSTLDAIRYATGAPGAPGWSPVPWWAVSCFTCMLTRALVGSPPWAVPLGLVSFSTTKFACGVEPFTVKACAKVESQPKDVVTL